MPRNATIGPGYIGPKDYVAYLYLAILITVIVLFNEQFGRLTKLHPYLMGFAKFSLLATFGECLKNRRTNRTWKISRPVLRFIVWGFFGIWITAAFKAIVFSTSGLVNEGMWWNGPAFWLAVSNSFSINWFSGFAFVMMLSHEYCNQCIMHGRIISLPQFAGHMADDKVARFWYVVITLTILLFWTPMHIITFLLPEVYRVSFAAGLSLALGYITTIVKK